jgi:hypothetical protein
MPIPLPSAGKTRAKVGYKFPTIVIMTVSSLQGPLWRPEFINLDFRSEPHGSSFPY